MAIYYYWWLKWHLAAGFACDWVHMSLANAYNTMTDLEEILPPNKLSSTVWWLCMNRLDELALDVTVDITLGGGFLDDTKGPVPRSLGLPIAAAIYCPTSSTYPPGVPLCMTCWQWSRWCFYPGKKFDVMDSFLLDPLGWLEVGAPHQGDQWLMVHEVGLSVFVKEKGITQRRDKGHVTLIFCDELVLLLSTYVLFYIYIAT